MRILANHPSQPRMVMSDKTCLKLIGQEVYFDSIIIGENVTLADVVLLIEEADGYPQYNGVEVEKQSIINAAREGIETEITNIINTALNQEPSSEPLPWTRNAFAVKGGEYLCPDDNNIYLCLEGHIMKHGILTSQEKSKWVLKPANPVTDDYDIWMPYGRNYKQGEFYRENGILYECLKNNTSMKPSELPTSWKVVS